MKKALCIFLLLLLVSCRKQEVSIGQDANVPFECTATISDTEYLLSYKNPANARLTLESGISFCLENGEVIIRYGELCFAPEDAYFKDNSPAFLFLKDLAQSLPRATLDKSGKIVQIASAKITNFKIIK